MVRAHIRLRAHLDQFPLHSCASAPAEKKIVEMEPKNRCLHLLTQNILNFFLEVTFK